MTALDLDALLALREQATGGEWTTAPGFGRRTDVIAVAGDGSDCFTLAEDLYPYDAALIVAAVNALPELVAKAREVDRLRELLDLAADHVPGDCDHHDEILAALSPSDGGDQ